MQIKDKFVQYIEGLLTEEEKALVDNHLVECDECQKEFSAMMEIQERLVLSGRRNRSADLEDKVFDRIVCEQNKRLKKTLKPNPWLEYWRSIMKSRMKRLSAATAMVFAVIIGITIFYKSEPVATAQDVLSEAVKAATGLNLIHMKARMRSSPNDNFVGIDLNLDFIPIEMWKQVDNGKLKWRIEKAGRYVVMDGETTTLVIKENEITTHAYRLEVAGPLGCCFDSWMGRLLDVKGILDNELQQAKDDPDREIRLSHEQIDGRDKTILEVDAKTDIPEDDYLRDTSISDSDSLKVYQFDSDTKLLEDFKIYVIEKGQEILVFEITEIEYNAQLEESLFVLDLPNDVFWLGEPEILSDNNRYSKMTPKEAAIILFEACSKGDWDEVVKFLPVSDTDQEPMKQEIKDYLAGLEIMSIGEPFQSKGYVGWFIPYSIRLNCGEVRERNLALRNDNKAKRYVVDGGF